jgi:hypothetical protein
MKHLLAFALLALLVSCGSSGPTRPGPLHYIIEERYIARIAPADRPEVTQAKVDYETAESESLHAQDDLREAQSGLSMAENERKQSDLDEQNVKLKVKNAEATGDMTRINAAKKELETSNLGKQAALAKLDFARARLSWAKKQELYTAHQQFYAQAKLEYAKAKVAKANNIQPQGQTFAPENYEKQMNERKTSADHAKAAADADLDKVKAKENAWKQAERTWNAARGMGAETLGAQ